jgi:hypothetical protein
MQQSHIWQMLARAILVFKDMPSLFPACYFKPSSGAWRRPVCALVMVQGRLLGKIPTRQPRAATSGRTTAIRRAGAAGVALFFTMKAAPAARFTAQFWLALADSA